jgi:hypothetical protein
MIGCPCCGMTSDPPPAPPVACEDCGQDIDDEQAEKCKSMGAVPLCAPCLAKYPDE